MNDRIFIDTNVLIYSFDTAEPTKQSKAKALLANFFEDEDCFISSQVVNEFSAAALKKLNPPLGLEPLRHFILALPENRILRVHKRTTLLALEIMKKYKFSYWDSLIAATAYENRCTILYTEDFQSGFVMEKKMSILNPFG